jgi:hypothetical protein
MGDLAKSPHQFFEVPLRAVMMDFNASVVIFNHIPSPLPDVRYGKKRMPFVPEER